MPYQSPFKFEQINVDQNSETPLGSGHLESKHQVGLENHHSRVNSVKTKNSQIYETGKCLWEYSNSHQTYDGMNDQIEEVTHIEQQK